MDLIQVLVVDIGVGREGENGFVLQIRRYSNSDRDTVWMLHNEGLLGTEAHAGPGPWDDDLLEIENRYLDGSGEFLIGELGGRAIAMGAIRRADASTAEVKRMRVLPAFQHQGYGTKILAALEERARELGYRRIKLDTTERQVSAQRFYEKYGYRTAGTGLWQGFTVMFYEKEL